MPKITIVGTTSWGITLGVALSRKDFPVCLWARSEKEAARIRNVRQATRILPTGFRLPPYLTVSSSLAEAMDGAKAVIMAVPSQAMRENIKLVAPFLSKSVLVANAAKGLEIGSGLRMSQVIAEEIDPAFWYNICVISGPNIAWEILNGLPAMTVVAAEKKSVARKAQKMLTAPNFCAYTNTDVIGVELGGALKNIIALGAGIADGLEYGDNAKSALVTRGLTEITALGAALGANPLTFAGLAGLGDLIVTCSSHLSRNHYVGVELTKGRSLKEITDSMENVAEGVTTTSVAWNLAQGLELEMPITQRIYQVLYEGANIQAAAVELMADTARHELAGRKWKLFSFFRKSRKKP
ncbi:MAG: NAD(P)H-dependent glycerol-3-phosphate dehydrogenase [Dehalococcoidales bacterium]